ncbi:hypothetical protein NDU88_006010 [Pleurodeles waltl]|uniref:Uncharacterized protein n=1 Tax=Pleurodeles waltl TaxID=8319 RepID=A0AAV7VQ76_PLEWA|nr:hypothetical protein NDU88_006010 [Pleurodeles waltl]
MRSLPFGRSAVKRSAEAILAFPLGWRPPAKGAPAGPAGKALQHRSRLRKEPAVLQGCDGCSCTRRDFHCLLYSPVRGPLHWPCQWHGQCRGPQGPHDTHSRHPVPGGEKRQKQAGGKGVGMPCRILPAGGNPAGNRRTRLGDRCFTAAVGMPNEAPPACWRCFRRHPPWRS